MGYYHDFVQTVARSRFGGWLILNVLTPLDRRLLRWTGGRFHSSIGTGFRRASVLLRCTGARSGEPREVPVFATRRGDHFILVASATGRDRNPAWYHNLKAHPECSLVLGDEGELACVAHEAHGQERELAWQAAADLYPGYNDYQARTERAIPVMILVPTPPSR
ncbi:MAG: nitroreductase/quinone reductase family protein [Myxococcales bacterium]|nr:nitroreductase/quinone reductase family protein [Myxococcales bacterium]MDD9968185.1 nitroreductase/quinone reductase family protein [Myxococcales bacterium]